MRMNTKIKEQGNQEKN